MPLLWWAVRIGGISSISSREAAFQLAPRKSGIYLELSQRLSQHLVRTPNQTMQAKHDYLMSISNDK